MTLRGGEAFGRYRIEGVLGRGAMGVVYRAHDSVLHRMVALKVLSAEPGSPDDAPPSSEGGARILREARAAARLTHPNAVAIYDVGEVGGVPFLAMEFVEGRTLRAFLGDGAIGLATKLRWLVDIAHALGGAHLLGLVHRDVKPDNVMVRGDGFVKVLDFGIARGPREHGRAGTEDRQAGAESLGLAALAKLAEGAPELGTLTAEGVIVGTPVYMAPEQLRGEAIDGRTDQFAWGALAHELLTGRLPWGGEGVGVLSSILAQEIPPLAQLAPEIPTKVDAAIRRALSKAPDDRFRSMDDLAADLEPFAASSSRQTVRPEPEAALGDALQIIVWDRIFVLVDGGRARPSDYMTLGEIVLKQTGRHPAGIGGLVIIPPDAKPPAEATRAAMNDLLLRLGSSLRCVCWLVEGTGFQGAMVRGVLTGVRAFGRLPYESHISSEIGDALEWIVRRLGGADERLDTIPDGIRWIEERRRRTER